MKVMHLIPNMTGGGAERLVFDWPESQDEIEITKTYLNELLPNKRFVLNRFMLIKRLFKEVHRIKPHIIHTHLSLPFYLGAILKFRFGIKWIHTEHNTYNRRQKYRVIVLIDKILYKYCDLIVAISSGTKKRVQKIYSDKLNLIVIDNGIKLRNIGKNSPIQGRGLKIASVGSLSYQKGYDIAINQLSNLKNLEIKQYHIYGKGEMYGELLGLIAKSKLDIRLMGWTDDIDKVFDDADVLLIPSRWEGFGLVAVEALSTGTPIIISDVDGMNMFAEKCNISVRSFELNNSECFESALLSIQDGLIRDPALVAYSARRLAENFDCEKMHKNYQNVYSTLIR